MALEVTTYMRIAGVCFGFLAAAVLAATSASGTHAASVTFERLYELKPGEGVFAYARISPNGQLLAYASELPSPTTRRIVQTETVIDLKTKQVLFTEEGIDAYWSHDNERFIFLSFAGGPHTVAIRHHPGGAITRDVAPVPLGDYFSWAVRDGRNLILTIQNNFYYLDGDKAVLPASRIPPCPGIGVGARPLISKDGRRVTTFVGTTVYVRDLEDCNNILNTGLQGAKADFSWDGRYVAFHVARSDGNGSEIVIVDTQDRTVRTLTGLQGSALFPSWTKDGRLCFRYDGADYRGFMMASDVLSLPARPLPAVPSRAPEPARLTWTDLFDTPAAHRTNLVMIWSDWSPHAPNALVDLQQLAADVRARGLDVGVLTVVPHDSRREDIDRILRAHDIHLPELTMRADRLALTGARNQIPTELLFQDGVLIDQRLGPQSLGELEEWTGTGTSQKFEARSQKLKPRSQKLEARSQR